MYVKYNCYAYGESQEAGNSPKLQANTRVFEIGPREMQPNGHKVTYVLAGEIVQRVLVDALAPAN